MTSFGPRSDDRQASRSHPRLQERRRRVEERLAAHDLLGGPRLLALAGVGRVPAGDVAPRLAAACAELGGLFALFARYLGSRADLFSLEDCAVLNEVAVASRPAVPFADVAATLESELGAAPGEIFTDFDERPAALPSGLALSPFHQVHHAVTVDDHRVVVRVLRPEAEAGTDADLQLLPVLRRSFAEPSAVDLAIEEFRESLAQELDLGLRARAFEELRRDAPESLALVLPRVDPGRSARRVLTLDALGGTPLTAMDADQAAIHDLGHRLSLVWLHLALSSASFPVDADLLLLDDGRLGLAWASFAAAGQPSRRHFWDYLQATADHDAEGVFTCLCREITESPGRASGSSLAELRRHLRQRVPSRQGALGATGESLADHLMLHWRLVHQWHYRPTPALRELYRGVLWSARSSRELCPPNGTGPARDALRDALEDQRWLREWAQMRQLGDPRQLAMMMETYLQAASVLPQQIDRMLDASGGATQARGGVQPGSPAEATADSQALAISLGLAMAALILLLHRFSVLDPSGWVERFGALAFLACGALFLVAAGGRR